jgi:hypothetical protein
MKLSIFIDVVILLLLFFFLKRKKLHLHENIFLLMILEFLVTSYCAIIYINLDHWSIAKRTELFIIFRVYEVVMYPVIWIGYFNLLYWKSSRTYQWLLTLGTIGIQAGIEQWLRKWGVIIYRDWSLLQSLLIQMLVLFIAAISLYWFRYMEGRETT